MAGACQRSITRDGANGGPGGRHLHTGPVAVADWPKPMPERTVAMATGRQCKKVIGLI